MAARASFLAASLALFSPAAAAAPARIDLPAAPLGLSLDRLAARTGVSIGVAGRLPAFTAKAVRGAASPAEALRQMLAGTGYRAVATGPSSFRIEPDPRRAASPPSDPQASEAIVTALRTPRRLIDVPATIRVVAPDMLVAPGALRDSAALVAETPALSSAGLGAGRNRLFLRGIGDGPLDGFNQGSVAVLLDEARLTWDAPDPDWALVDIDRIEVLEGPQGPLYGTGALGGIVKIVTRAPDPAALAGRIELGAALTRDGDVSDSQQAMLNLPLAPDLAVRAVAYRQQQAGWIDDAGGKSDVNGELTSGGRVALRWTLGGWRADLVAAAQGRHARDSQYVDGDLGALVRPDRDRETRDVDARLANLTLTGPVGRLTLTSVTALSGQESQSFYDAGVGLVEDDRHYHLFDQEVRIAGPGGGRIDWLAGVSLVRASTDATIVGDAAAPNLPSLALQRSITEAALFGQAGLRLSPTLKLEGGARLFSTALDDEGSENDTSEVSRRHALRGSGSLSLAWTPDPRRLFFLRAASAYRAGGSNVPPGASQPDYAADHLASLEAGTRLRLPHGVSIEATLFGTRWRHVQADELLASGLIATRNAGNARNVGVEGELRWAPSRRAELSLAGIVQSARLEGGSATLPDSDPRLAAVPQVAARMRGTRHWRVGEFDVAASLGLHYVGATHLSFDPTLDRRTPGRFTADAGVTARDGPWTLSISGDNLGDSHADSFAFGNPYRVRADPQRTPLRPRTIGVTVRRDY